MTITTEERTITVYEDVPKCAFYIVDSDHPETLHPVGYAQGDDDDRENAKNEADDRALHMADDRLISREAVSYGGPWQDA